jgi:hypothetical protein
MTFPAKFMDWMEKIEQTLRPPLEKTEGVPKEKEKKRKRSRK